MRVLYGSYRPINVTFEWKKIDLAQPSKTSNENSSPVASPHMNHRSRRKIDAILEHFLPYNGLARQTANHFHDPLNVFSFELFVCGDVIALHIILYFRIWFPAFETNFLKREND